MAKTVPSAIIPPMKHCSPIYDPSAAEISAIGIGMEYNGVKEENNAVLIR